MIIERLKNIERARNITISERDELINQYEYLRDRNIPISHTTFIDDWKVLINQIRKTYWYNLTFEDWFRPKYYVTDCECEGSSLSDLISTINRNDALRCSRGYEILTRNQNIDNGYLTITTTYKKIESYSEYKKNEELVFMSERASNLEKTGACFSTVLGDWVL